MKKIISPVGYLTGLLLASGVIAMIFSIRDMIGFEKKAKSFSTSFLQFLFFSLR